MHKHYLLYHFILLWCIFVIYRHFYWRIIVTFVILSLLLWLLFFINHFLSIWAKVLIFLYLLNSRLLRWSFFLYTISLWFWFVKVHKLVFDLLKTFFEKCTYFIHCFFCFISYTFFLLLLTLFWIFFTLILLLLYLLLLRDRVALPLLLLLALTLPIVALIIVVWTLST